MEKHLFRHVMGRCLLTAVMAGMSVAASAVETKYINSQSDWENFVKNYDNKTEVNLLLNCDVKFETQGKQIDKFVGTLDGQGHAFVLNYKDNKEGDQNKDYYDENWTEDSAPFEDAEGTIKNLRLTGTIAIRYGFAAYRENNPLVRDPTGKLLIENCHSDVAFVNTGDMASGWNRCFIGGFVGQSSEGSEVTFRNCSFTGSFICTDPDGGHDYNDTGGFIGYPSSRGKVYVENSFSYITYDKRGTVELFSYFVGHSDIDVKVTNSYGYSVSLEGEVKTLANDEKCTDLTTTNIGAEFIRNGGLTMALNVGSDVAGSKWAQTVGTDAVPKLKTFSPESETLTNLVTNGDFTNDETSWSSSSGTSHIETESKNKFWRTSYAATELKQTIDLTSHYTENELAANNYKAVMTCNWAHQYGYRVLTVNCAFLDANGNQLGTYDLINKTNCSTELSALTWESVGGNTTVPKGTRKVTVTLKGQDYKNWDGNFGPGFDNVGLALVKTANEPTGINTATQRPAPSDNRRYTLSGVPAGKGAKGIIIQGGKKRIVR